MLFSKNYGIFLKEGACDNLGIWWWYKILSHKKINNNQVSSKDTAIRNIVDKIGIMPSILSYDKLRLDFSWVQCCNIYQKGAENTLGLRL